LGGPGGRQFSPREGRVYPGGVALPASSCSRRYARLGELHGDGGAAKMGGSAASGRRMFAAAFGPMSAAGKFLPMAGAEGARPSRIEILPRAIIGGPCSLLGPSTCSSTGPISTPAALAGGHVNSLPTPMRPSVAARTVRRDVFFGCEGPRQWALYSLSLPSGYSTATSPLPRARVPSPPAAGWPVFRKIWPVQPALGRRARGSLPVALISIWGGHCCGFSGTLRSRLTNMAVLCLRHLLDSVVCRSSVLRRSFPMPHGPYSRQGAIRSTFFFLLLFFLRASHVLDRGATAFKTARVGNRLAPLGCFIPDRLAPLSLSTQGARPSKKSTAGPEPSR